MRRKRSIPFMSVFAIVGVLLACAAAACLPDLPAEKVDAGAMYRAAHKRAVTEVAP